MEQNQASSILDIAKQLTSEERQKQYGSPDDNFQTIANFWNVYLKKRLCAPLTAFDVGMLMDLLKTSREMHHHNKDNLIDKCGYIRCCAIISGDERSEM